MSPGRTGLLITSADTVQVRYNGDKLFKGKMRDFRVYNRALLPGEVLEVSGNTTGIAAATHFFPPPSPAPG
ncbi:LamG domain-containing protein [Streptomyces sp. NBC_01231]|nr:LamG domain-containing protein [Streptomyces sp. NBC_01231]